MVEVASTNIIRSVDGDEVKVTADLSSVGNGETWTVPHISNITFWSFSCTTDDDTGGTVSGNVITFANGASIAGKCRVWGK
jgi:hypothetical protein